MNTVIPVGVEFGRVNVQERRGLALVHRLSAVISRTGWDQTARIVLCLVVLALWAPAVGWLVVVPVLSWRSTHFVVTDRRLMFRQGLFHPNRHRRSARQDRRNRVRARPDRKIAGHRNAHRRMQCRGSVGVYDVSAVERVHALLYSEVFDADGRGSNHG